MENAAWVIKKNILLTILFSIFPHNKYSKFLYIKILRQFVFFLFFD